MFKHILIVTYILCALSASAFADSSSWEVELPVAKETIEQIAQDMATPYYYEDEGQECGGEVGAISLKAFNPVDWQGFMPGISNIQSYTSNAFYKFSVEISSAVAYCADTEWLDCEISFESFDSATGKLDTASFTTICYAD